MILLVDTIRTLNTPSGNSRRAWLVRGLDAKQRGVRSVVVRDDGSGRLAALPGHTVIEGAVFDLPIRRWKELATLSPRNTTGEILAALGLD